MQEVAGDQHGTTRVRRRDALVGSRCMRRSNRTSREKPIASYSGPMGTTTVFWKIPSREICSYFIQNSTNRCTLTAAPNFTPCLIVRISYTLPLQCTCSRVRDCLRTSHLFSPLSLTTVLLYRTALYCTRRCIEKKLEKALIPASVDYLILVLPLMRPVCVCRCFLCEAHCVQSGYIFSTISIAVLLNWVL